jgi:hypothetical protein
MESSAQEQRERQATLAASSAAMKASAEAQSRQHSIVALGDNEGPVEWGSIGRGNAEEPLGFGDRNIHPPEQLVDLLRDCSSAARDERNAQLGIIISP